jgi:hypothetical protein
VQILGAEQAEKFRMGAKIAPGKQRKLAQTCSDF